MKHRLRPLEQDDLLRPRLVDLIDLRHELVKLAALIDPPTPTGQRRRVNRWLMLKERLAGEALVIGGLDPASDHRLV